MRVIERGKNIWLMMLGLVLCSNFMLYRTHIGNNLLPSDTKAVVLGSLIDLVIMLPLYSMLFSKKFSLKTAMILSATGCILARLLIPKQLLEPFAAITWAGIAVEAAFIIFELMLIATLVRVIPKIVGKVKKSALPLVFAFPYAIDEYIKKNPIVQVICSEAMMFYYAFFSWKKTPPTGITLYKRSSYIAFQVMMIHAIVIETLGIHLWLHHKSMVISIILLVLNLYSVIFFLADMQAVRLNPVHIHQGSMFLSIGLQKRIEIQFDNIECIKEDPAILESKLSKDTLEFVARDFEKVHPDLILKMNTPVKATLFMGIQKKYSQIAIRSDQPEQLKEMIVHAMENKNVEG
ncbi:beta-carotene 15,15'-monooxygenase [Paenibacillus sp. KQZ6P-2]|uniref:Beta-carotene 15,15'-monooxygenase n=1 Tax=Paenibacillus mangrovi TaxID=2931978 RepID=A0A9X2B4Z8_9BACL|nr:beta-carotene 15,15'-monooxygenase [Paenibacillus mangrovi]MCJ8011493.1 beta-carotene 15,15'-monooxygenase [Paenibacillus mangrovi]